MFRISRFAEVLKSLPRGLFDREVAKREADKHRKGFSCWRQLVSMVYLQLSGATSLRVLESGFNAHAGHHYHLGCGPIRRSTLAEANARGDWEVFSCVAHALMQQVRGSKAGEAKALLQLLDSTSVTLKGPGFDEWTQDNRTRHTQGLKLHVLLGLSEQAPLDQWISAPNINDIEYARTLELQREVIYVFDRGYCDYSWWWQITCSGARFVTRFKRNARLQLLSTRSIPRNAEGHILKDQLVRLSNKNPGAGRTNPYEGTLRRIEVARQGQPALVLATNDLKSSALHIAERYKARWQIELFFKWIKQHLNIKRLVGRTENAVRIQILTALIAYLLVRLHAAAHKVSASGLWQHLAQLRSALFQRCYTDLHRHRRWREQRSAFEASQCPLFT
jgi:putative transposase